MPRRKLYGACAFDEYYDEADYACLISLLYQRQLCDRLRLCNVDKNVRIMEAVMNQFNCLLMSILLLSINALAGAQEATGPHPDIPVTGYSLIWSDEFNGTALDMTKWGYRSLGPRRDAVNVKETVSLDGAGHLVLTTERDGNDVHTAMIGTEGTFQATFGYYECRAKLQRQIGHWSAIWLHPPTMGKEIGNPSESGTKIDIFDGLLSLRGSYSETYSDLINIRWTCSQRKRAWILKNKQNVLRVNGTKDKLAMRKLRYY